MRICRPTVASTLYCIVLLLFLLASISCFKKVPGRLVCTIDYKALGLHDVAEEGGGSFSVLTGDRVAVTEGKELLLIDSGLITTRVLLPTNVSSFDLTSEGNGVLQKGDSLYIVRNLFVDSIPHRLISPDSLAGSVIIDIDMISPSGIRLTYIPSRRNHDLLEYSATTTLDSVQHGKFAIKFEPLPRLPYSDPGYIADIDSTFYLIDWLENGVLQVGIYAIDADGFNRRQGIQLGVSGELTAFMMNFVQYDEATGLFYVMIERNEKLVIYEYDIRDFQEK
ncbi:MAG: hypothetical protein IPH75_10910 [bacterium]|nr:hypothetical protein [bacterium]